MMEAHIEALKNEIANQESLDQDHIPDMPMKATSEKTNRYVKDLEKDLLEWENYFSYHAEPQLRKVLQISMKSSFITALTTGFIIS